MSMSSPKVDRAINNHDDNSFLHLSSTKNDVNEAREKVKKGTPQPPNYSPERILMQKGFSPILTPHKSKKTLVGESALRTPNLKDFGSNEKESPLIINSDHRLY